MSDSNTNPPNTSISPEVVVEQLRAIRARMADATPITPGQRRVMRWTAESHHEVVQSTINMIDFSTPVQQALNRPAAGVRDLQQDSSRWSAVEDELRSLLQAVAGANYIRRHQLGLITAQAYSIGAQLVRDPVNADLLPHVREIKRLRAIAHRRKPPQPSPAPTPEPSMT
jgi:hypothetical protein